MSVTDEGLDGDYGEWDAKKRLVKVAPKLQPETTDHTVAHEWFHVIFWDAGLTNLFPPGMEELVCDTLATAFVASNTKPKEYK